MLDRSVRGSKNDLDVLQEGSAGSGEVRAVFSMAEQSNADLPLQLFDLKTERLRFHVQAGSRTAKVEFLRHDAEVAEVAQFHDSDRGRLRYGMEVACFERICILRHEGLEAREFGSVG